MSDDDEGDETSEVDPKPPAVPAEGAVIADDGTWIDSEKTRGDRPLFFDRDAEQQRHQNSMQSYLLLGLGVVFLVTLLLIVGVVAFGGMTEDLAKTLAQLIFPTLLGFGGAIVGTLFRK